MEVLATEKGPRGEVYQLAVKGPGAKGWIAVVQPGLEPACWQLDTGELVAKQACPLRDALLRCVVDFDARAAVSRAVYDVASIADPKARRIRAEWWASQ